MTGPSLRSMTGCGEGVATDAGTTVRVELRSVNNRFLKISLRTPEACSPLEPRIEAAIRDRVRRGSLHAAVVVSGASAPAARRLDLSQLAAYLDDLADFCLARDLPAPLTVAPLLGLPGVVAESAADPDAAERLWPTVRQALAESLDGLDAMRAREAVALAADVAGVCRDLRGLVAGVTERLPQVLTEHQVRLNTRVAALLEPQGMAPDPASIAREIAILADRSDVAEELVRLGSHLDQVERLLGEPASGRALDFLAQELAREANTIGSKSADIAVAHAVVTMKSRIERLREQVQNIE
jgi:uncharacterized protein (TIGR00255 family)